MTDFNRGFAPFAALLVLTISTPGIAQVTVDLVAADQSVQPGQTTTVAVRMEHAPSWHTYWINAGIGSPTKIGWTLPNGWRAGDISWPTPQAITNASGEVTGQGYSDLLYLPVPLNVPAAARSGSTVTITAHVDWVMCSDVCIPSQQELSLLLPVSADSPKPNQEVRDGLAAMSMPEQALNWRVEAIGTSSGTILEVSAPEAAKTPHFFSEDPFIAYDQPQSLKGDSKTFALSLAQDPEVGRPARLKGILAYKDASDRYRGVKVDVPFSSADAAVATVGGTAGGQAKALSAGVLVLAFFGGLILNLMPCVFPVLGIKVVGFINQAGSDRRKVTMHGLMFTAGVLLSFWALAGALAALRAGGEQLGWGFQLQSAPFVFALAVIMLIFALSLSGVFEFGVRATAVGGELQMKEGYSGSFFAGVLATVVATPCSAPFLAPALGAALALPTGASFVVFTVIAIGLSAPYLLLSAFPQAVGILPRPGRWMETFKQVMAFPLYATVGYLVWVLAGQTSENGLARRAVQPDADCHGCMAAMGATSRSGSDGKRTGLAFARGAGPARARPVFRLAPGGQGERHHVGAVERGARGATSARGAADLRGFHRALVRDLPGQQEAGVRIRQGAQAPRGSQCRAAESGLDQRGSEDHRGAREMESQRGAVQSRLPPRSSRT